MYEAMRDRAPDSTRIAGMSTTVLVMAAVSFALANGIGERIVRVIQPPTILVDLPDDVTPEPREQREVIELDPVDLPRTAPPIPRPDNFAFDRDTTITVESGPAPGPNTTPGPAAPAARAPVRVAPRLLPAPPPPYPAREIRAKAEGVSTLELCIDSRGRVTSANVTRSSGSRYLDEAALKWVKQARFAAGTVDGVAEAVCGRAIEYVWRLVDAS